MQNNLLSIFNAITPDNIKDIPVISDSMEIFIELLNEYSPISSDISIALSEQTTESISEELPKIYLYDYYSMIENLKSNKTVINKFKLWNESLKPNIYPKGMPLIGDKLLVNYFTIGEPGGALTTEEESNVGLEDINLFPLSDKINLLQTNMLQNRAENYFINRLFKESKGLKKGINFIYDILNEHLVNANERLELEITETGSPFELNMIGSIDKDVYNESVAYLSHPLGFVYEYTYLAEMKFDDNYSLSKFYDVRTLEVRCLSGNVEVYSTDVSSVIDEDNYVKVTFKNNYYLLQENDIVRYYDNLNNLIKIYPGDNHCSIYIDYDVIYTTTLDDSILIKDISTSTETTTIVNTITENTAFNESKTFMFNFIVGISTIGTDLISDDSDQIEVAGYNETTAFNTIDSNSETFNTSDVVDTFDIEVL